MTKGEMQIGTFNRTDRAYRKFCTKCGGHIMAALRFTPRMRIFYSEKALKIADGLPKFKDLPPDVGGSGEMIPE